MSIKKVKIGNVTLDNPFILGPMAGVTDQPFRILCHEMGAALVCIKGMSDGFDTQLVKHVLVILLCCESHWLLSEGCCAEQAAGD